MTEQDGEGQIAANEPEISTPDSSGQTSGLLLQASWSGPLPPPGALQQYDAAVPGAVNRILVMAENAQQHEIDLEKAASAREDKILASDVSQSKRGLWFAFISALFVIGSGAFLILLGKGVWGLAVILTPLAALAGLFVYGTETRKAERRRNSANRLAE